MPTTQQEKLIAFFQKYKKVSYKKGRTILNSQDTPQGVYYVQKGFVKDSTDSRDGKSITLILFKEGDIFPYSWIFNDIPNSHTFESYTDTIIFRAPKDEFLKFLLENPDVFLKVTQRILLRLRGILQRLQDFAFGSAHERIASIFAIMAERFGEKQKEGTVITIPLSHREIAELVGLTRETASIEIKKLEKDNIILRKSKYYLVKNLKTLLKNSPSRFS